MKKTTGIRVDEEAEVEGLDIPEHGMWGYPESSIPVPGGYGRSSHTHGFATHPARSSEPSFSPGGMTVAPGQGD